jgi:hypothetical protein
MAIRNLDASSGANMISDATGGAVGLTFSSNVVDGIPLGISRSTIGAATVGMITFQASGASIPVFQFGGSAMASVSTIQFTTGGVAGTMAIRVTNSAGTVLGWIPVMPSAAVTAIAV